MSEESNTFNPVYGRTPPETREERRKRLKREWKQKNKDIVNAASKLYYQKNKAKIDERHRNYNREQRILHHDELLQKQRTYRQQNKEKVRQQAKTLRQQNKEKYRARGREQYRKHQASIRARAREQYRENQAKIRTRKRELRQQDPERFQKSKAYRDKDKLEVITHYCLGGPIKCALCPDDRIAALTIDHIKGGGEKHRRSIGRNGSPFYGWLKKQGYPEGYRVLCANCNWREFLAVVRATMSTKLGTVRSRICMRKRKIRFMALLGGACVICGITDIDVLTVHHQNGDGGQHRQAISAGRGGDSFYRHILNTMDITGLECRCFSCNDAHER